MVKIDFTEPTSQDWIKWRKECAKEQKNHNAAIVSGNVSEVKSTVYKGENFGIKFNVYFAAKGPFSGKCAFCESNILSDQPGDVEHYRPKSAVKNEDDTDVIVNIGGKKKPHPGYFWLAYAWENLLPSCRDCNSITKKKTAGIKIGKGTCFPVKGFRAVKPGEHIREEPLLINPVLVDPNQHISIDKNGILYSSTPEGITTIRIFGLNTREALVTARETEYENGRRLAKMYLCELMTNGQDMDVSFKRIQSINAGKVPYSIAAIQGIKDALHEYDDKFQDLKKAVAF